MLATPSHLLHVPRNHWQEHSCYDFPKDQKAGKPESIHQLYGLSIINFFLSLQADIELSHGSSQLSHHRTETRCSPELCGLKLLFFINDNLASSSLSFYWADVHHLYEGSSHTEHPRTLQLFHQATFHHLSPVTKLLSIIY